MIIKITENDLYSEYPEFAKNLVSAKYEGWKKELNPLFPLMRGRRCFIIFRPEYKTSNKTIDIEDGPFSWVVLPELDRQMTETILRDWCVQMGEEERNIFFRIIAGGFKETPFEKVKILELSPELFLPPFFSRAILGYFGLIPFNIACDVTVKGIANGTYCGVTGEVEYDPVKKTFRATEKMYDEFFEKQFNKCYAVYDPFLTRVFPMGTDSKKTETAKELGLEKGTIVNHPKKGRGTILNLVKGNDGVRVKFDSLKAPVYVYGKNLKELQIIEK